jgi:hypothetical protein
MLPITTKVFAWINVIYFVLIVGLLNWRCSLNAHQEQPVRIYLFGAFKLQRGKRVLLADSCKRRKAVVLFKRLAFAL